MLHAEPGSNILRLRLCQPARPEIAMHTRRSLLLTAAVGGLALLAPAARAASDQGLVDEARITVQDFTGDTQFTDMRRKLARAKGVFIVPQLLKASFIISGAGGSGVLLAKTQTARTSTSKN